MENKTAVLISCFNWYDNRLKYIENYLNKRDFRVSIFMSDFNHLHKKYIQELSSVKGRVRYVHVPKYKRNISLRRLYSHWSFTQNVRDFVEESPPDFVYCLVPPNSLVRELTILKHRIGFKLVFDVIDIWPESYTSMKLFPFSVWRNLRDLYIDKADCVVLECEYYADLLGERVAADKMKVFRLVKSPLHIANNSVDESDFLNLCYLGSINRLIDIDRICTIVSIMKKIKPIQVKIIGDGENKDRFIDALEKENVTVRYFGKVFDAEEKCNIFKDCHFGINIYKPCVSIGLTMKSVDYFQMGIPIINSIHGDTEMLVNKYGVGINIWDISESSIDDFLLNYRRHQSNVVSVFNNFISDHNVYDRLNFLDELM